jgi:hypothetical protein
MVVIVVTSANFVDAAAPRRDEETASGALDHTLPSLQTAAKSLVVGFLLHALQCCRSACRLSSWLGLGIKPTGPVRALQSLL